MESSVIDLTGDGKVTKQITKEGSGDPPKNGTTVKGNKITV